MSGPITVSMLVDPVQVLLLATGLRAARRIAEALADASRMHSAQQDEQRQWQERLAALATLQQQAFDAAVQGAEARYAQLLALAQSIGLGEQVVAGRPVFSQLNPGTDPRAHQAAWLDALQAFNRELQGVLQYEMARRIELGQLAEPTFDEWAALAGSGLAQGAQGGKGVQGVQGGPESSMPGRLARLAGAESPALLARRLLARIASFGPVPPDMARVAQALAGSEPGERAQLLASDLRLRIQRHIAAHGATLLQQAQALVVEQSLKDLGYQVEPIGETLFVAGGIVHFRKQGWGDYLVRMRILPATSGQAASANFNVVRRVAQAQNEISVLDHLAEDRWCAEFPALQALLAARGIRFDVTRRLEAGQLPVQCVHESLLPGWLDGAAAADAAATDFDSDALATGRMRAAPLPKPKP